MVALGDIDYTERNWSPLPHEADSTRNSSDVAGTPTDLAKSRELSFHF